MRKMESLLGAGLLAATLVVPLFPNGSLAADAGSGSFRHYIEIQAQTTSQPLPYYSRQLKDVGVQGRVLVAAHIGADGRIGDSIDVLQGHPLLAKEVRRALHKWQFDALAMRRGNEGVDLTLAFDFKLKRWPVAGGRSAGAVTARLVVLAPPRLPV